MFRPRVHPTAIVVAAAIVLGACGQSPDVTGSSADEPTGAGASTTVVADRATTADEPTVEDRDATSTTTERPADEPAAGGSGRDDASSSPTAPASPIITTADGAIELPLPGPAGSSDPLEPETGVVIGHLTVETHEGGGFTTVPGPPSAGTPAGHGHGTHLKGGAGCAFQCITSGVAYAKGTGAELVVTTDTPARIWIVVTGDDGYHRQEMSFHGETSFSALFDDLEPETTYHAMAAAEEKPGAVSHAFGTFETAAFARTVQIGFSPVEVASWPTHLDATNARIYVRVNGQFYSEAAWIAGLAPIDGAERFLDLEVWVVVPQSSQAWSCGTGTPNNSPAWTDMPLNGANSCHAWAAAFRHGIDLDALSGGATWQTGHTMHRTLQTPAGGDALPGGYGGVPALSVPVTIGITYG
ncbi:MAG: hypothetical protein JJU45_10670 [Acidimicrobiia bacterium]|nr:hypothetical protein [Acidimicrobiia bacterium]